jgi:beta-N-acetylhexosaminidase
VTLAEQVGQLLWCGFEGARPSPVFAGRIAAGEIGAVVLFSRNLAGIDDTFALCAELHDLAPSRLLVAVDQEGGTVQRVRAPATVWPPMRRLGATGDAALAEAVGRALGEELAAIGIDLDFAPVLDVDTNPDNPVIGARSFARDAGEVTRLAGAFARGLAAAGVIACGKHFPGHGDTSVDSHLALPRVDHDLARLRAVELAPFRALAWLPTIMTAHVVFAALDDARPATLSPAVIEGLLRGELGYRGVVISDDLEMNAIVGHYGVCEAAEQAIAAGCDTLLICEREDWQQEVHAHLTRAAERSQALRRRVAESAARVAALKAGHPPPPRRAAAEALALLGRPEHQALAARLA